MKGLKKFGAIICAIAMIVSSITYYPTSNVSAATALPKKVIGLVANSKSGSDTIENAIMFAWAGADDPANVAGYDPTVTSTVIYIYKDGKQVTKIGNATKGGVVGGLSAGSYTAKAANVNSMGEGELSETVSFTVTGATLNYTYPVNCIGPKTPAGLSYITGNPEVPADNPAQADNKLGVAWAASSNASIPSADSSVVGYNLYLFDAKTGTPYRRVYVDGITKSNVILESVSAGEYLAYLSAVDAEGRESALAATSFGQSSKVTVKGQFIDNAQSFDKPNQPNLPLGLSILTEGIDYGFTIAWSGEADLTGQRLNLFVDGVCIKVGINGDVASYYENRLATGTYEVEVRSQYTSNNVESFGLKKTVSIKADPGLSGKTPAELADPAYSEYEEPTTNPTTTANPLPASPSSVPYEVFPLPELLFSFHTEGSVSVHRFWNLHGTDHTYFASRLLPPLQIHLLFHRFFSSVFLLLCPLQSDASDLSASEIIKQKSGSLCIIKLFPFFEAASRFCDLTKNFHGISLFRDTITFLEESCIMFFQIVDQF